jgi:hypothetical protein
MRTSAAIITSFAAIAASAPLQARTFPISGCNAIPEVGAGAGGAAGAGAGAGAGFPGFFPGVGGQAGADGSASGGWR